ncbi:MAG: DNA replication/repair protein RecF [Clostridia bacterium]
MLIKSVTLKNYRNYSERTVFFKDGLNVIVGENATGKTNLVESIYCCAIGKSPRTNKYKELIKWKEKYAYIKVVFSKKGRDYTIEFSIDDSDKKRILVDSIPLTRIGELLGELNVVYFSPDEMKLIKESPQERRKFIDISLSQQNKNYFYSLGNYNNILAQRNKLLKTVFDTNRLKDALFAWDRQLVKYGAYILEKRFEFVDKIKEYAREIHFFLTDNKEELQLEYESFSTHQTREEIEKNFLSALEENLEKDIKLQYTSVGLHRDDMSISANGIDIRKFGSQGQQRTAALSLTLAEIEFFKSEIGEKPVLLLDDVLSELDEKRRAKLMELSQGMQTIITCTDFNMTLSHNTIRTKTQC